MPAENGRFRTVVATLLGAAVGLGLGALGYQWLNPALESADGWLRETQGLAWNLVLLCAVAGAAGGAVWSRRRRR